MVTMVTDYSPYGDISEFIAGHHHDPEGFRAYRRRWNNNVDELLFLLIETTSTCNLRCPVCAHSVGYQQVPSMSDEIFALCLQGIQAMDIPSVCLNQYNEPLLDTKIFERIRRVVALDNVFDTFMNTNAVLLDETNGRRLIESGLHRLLIGFDGFSQEVYEKMRYGAQYDTVLKNVLRFLELKKEMNAIFPVVRISLVRSSLNENEIESWFEFWKDKVDYITIQEFITPVLDGSKSDLISKTSLRTQAAARFDGCEQPFERAIVRGNGDVIPCCSPFAVMMPIGNITRDSLKDIWNGTNVTELRAMFKGHRWREHPICSRCITISYQIGE